MQLRIETIHVFVATSIPSSRLLCCLCDSCRTSVSERTTTLQLEWSLAALLESMWNIFCVAAVVKTDKTGLTAFYRRGVYTEWLRQPMKPSSLDMVATVVACSGNLSAVAARSHVLRVLCILAESLNLMLKLAGARLINIDNKQIKPRARVLDLAGTQTERPHMHASAKQNQEQQRQAQ